MKRGRTTVKKLNNFKRIKRKSWKKYRIWTPKIKHF